MIRLAGNDVMVRVIVAEDEKITALDLKLGLKKSAIML
jgi:hypothetical protein